MSRPALMRHPIRMHISLEKETARKLQRIAKDRRTTTSGLLRELAESYTTGRMVVRPKGGEDLAKEIRDFRAKLPRLDIDVVKMIRDMRGHAR